jgi:hypothetical protein
MVKEKKNKILIGLGILILILFGILFFTNFGETIVGRVIDNLGIVKPAIIVE